MGIISEVKCGRCDRRFSGLRSRCPYCGARRGKRGKQSYESENSKAKMIVGAVLMLVLIVAVAALLITSLSDKPKDPSEASSPPPSMPGSDDVDTTQGPSQTPVEKDDDEPVDTTPTEPVAVVESIKIYYVGVEKTDVTMPVGQKLPFTTKTVPADTGEPVVWTSSDEKVFVVLSTGQVTAMAVGEATLTATCGGASWECKVRVKAK